MAYGSILRFFSDKQKGDAVILCYIEGTEPGGTGRTNKVFYFQSDSTDENALLSHCARFFGDGGYDEDDRAFFAGCTLRRTYPDEKPYAAGLNYKFVIRQPNYD